MNQQEQKFGLRKIYRKSWPWDNLFGSLRFETSSGQRGIWNDLLDMAKLSRVKPGLISPAPGLAYPHTWLAEFLNVPLDLLEETLGILVKTDRIEENHTGIRIINWHRYQTEADRQKPYRDKKRQEAQKFKKVKYCPECKWTIEDCKRFELMEVCPRCRKKGKEVLLEKRGYSEEEEE